MGGTSYNGTASNNTINITGGNLPKATVYGGLSTEVTSSNNVVNISEGDLSNAYIMGGTSNNGTASNNTINITGGNLSEAWIIAASATGTNGAASDNTINISGNPTLDNAHLRSSGTVDSTKDTLNIYTKNLSADCVANFKNINFYLDTENNKSNVQNGDTMLTVKTASIGGTKISGIIAGDTTLSDGDTVTLINATNGISDNENTSYTGTIAEGISFNHELNVTRNGNTIVATIGKWLN